MNLDLDKDKVKFFQKKILEWGKKNTRDFPWRRTEDPFSLLVAEILLQKTRAEKVEPVYRKFIQKFPTPEALANSTPNEIEEEIRELGLQKQKAGKIRKLGSDLTEIFGGEVPDRQERILSLPGVGKYTANAVLCFLFQEDLPLLDTNVLRVLNRFFRLDLEESDRKKDGTWKLIETLIPTGKGREFNLILLDFAAIICNPSPHCAGCPIKARCEYFD